MAVNRWKVYTDIGNLSIRVGAHMIKIRILEPLRLGEELFIEEMAQIKNNGIVTIALKNVKNCLMMIRCEPTLPKKGEYGVCVTAFSMKQT